jgi:hypothetical protein
MSDDRVRAIAPPPGAPRPRRTGGVALLLVGLAGTAFGFLAASSIGTGGVDTTGAAASTTTSTAPAPRGPLVDVVPVETTSTTTDPAAPRDRLPGFDATILLATDDALMWWNPARSAPETSPLPDEVDPMSVRWDAAGEWVSFTTGGSRPSVLWIGRSRSPGSWSPAFIGEHSAAWHTSRPGHIAWIGNRPDDDEPALYVGVMTSSGLDYARVARVPANRDASGSWWELIAWGDWGFGANRYDELHREPDFAVTAYAATAVTLAPDGTEVAAVPSARISAAAPDGTVVVTAQDFTTGILRSFLAGPDLGEVVVLPATDPFTWTLVFGNDGRFAARRPAGDGLVVGTTEMDLREYPAPPVTALAWSSDQRFVAFLPESSDRVGILDLASGDYEMLDPGAWAWRLRLRS